MILTVSLNPAVDADLEIERLHFEDRNPILAERRQPGGKAINISRVLHELGARTLALTTAGGRVGTELRQRLRAANIPTCVVPVRGETRVNLSLSERASGHSIRLNSRGPELTAEELRAVFAAVERVLPSAKMLALSGSLPPSVSSNVYARLIRLARRFGVPTALDADGQPLRHGIAARPWMVKPNRFEAERLLGEKMRDPLKAAKKIHLRFGVETVLLSLGNEGAVLVARGVCLQARPPRVRVRSAIGAGDSALAAFLWCWLKSRDLAGSLRWAMAAGAASAMRPAPELCRRQDVERLVRRINLLDCGGRVA